MTTINVPLEITPTDAFKILCETLSVDLKEEISPNDFKIEDGKIVLEGYDDRGELYLALYHLATKMFMNTEFRHLFENPNTFMSELYTKLNEENSSGVTKELHSYKQLLRKG